MIYSAIRSSGIRVQCSKKATFALKHDLTIRYRDYMTGEVHKVYCFREKGQYLWIPRHYPLQNVLIKDIDYRYDQFVTECSIVPRDDIQTKAIDALSRDLDDIILQLPPGFGKTVITIASLCRLGLKSLVLVDQRDLVEQWIDRINQFTNLNIKEDKKFELDQPIVVHTIQKFLAQLRKNPVELYRHVYKAKFGVVVFDEVHALIGPEQFTNVCFALPIKKYIAVSATPYRLDESGKILRYWTGERKFTANQLFNVTVEVICFNSGIQPKTWRYICYGDRLSRSRYLKMLAKQNAYYNVLLSQIQKLREQKRKLLILVERTDIVEQLSKRLKELNIQHTTYYGAQGRDNLKSDLIIATYAKCNKAIDIPHIDTLVYGTPITNEITLEQTKGRIQRMFEGKQSPLIVDLVDTSGDKTRNVLYMLEKRLTFYNNSGFAIKFNGCEERIHEMASTWC